MKTIALLCLLAVCVSACDHKGSRRYRNRIYADSVGRLVHSETEKMTKQLDSARMRIEESNAAV